MSSIIKKASLALLFCASILNADAIKWMKVDLALIDAKKNCKPLVVVVYKPGCPACELLYNKLNNSDLLKAGLAEFVTASISEQDALDQFGFTVEKTPTIYFMDGDKHELAPEIKGTPADNLELLDYIQKAAVVHEMETECMKND